MYCVSCRRVTRTLNRHTSATKNNRVLLRGTCFICKKNKTQFTKNITKKKKTGAGFANKILNSLPVELHLPGHQFTGPGTNLKKRLNRDLTPKRWSKPINRVDLASYHHDLCYNKFTDRSSRNKICDKNMLQELDGIKNPSLREKIERNLVKKIIGSKLKLGI